jgi:DNA-binding GntR family transcriptional regulator
MSESLRSGRPAAGWRATSLPENGAMQKSIVEAATARIRDEIMSGRIRPGDRIRLDTMKELLGVSHIPIREALRRLEGERLVENIPQRGTIATPLSMEEAAEIYDLRKIIEPAVAARALPVGRDRLRELSDVLEEMEAITEEWHSPDFAILHRRFHWLILEGGANRTIEQVLRQLWQTSQRYIIFGMTSVKRNESTVAAQHRRILNAVKRGDGERVARVIKAHLEHTESATREAMQLHQDEVGLAIEPNTAAAPRAAR